MAVRQLLENLEIDWQHLHGPTPVEGRGEGETLTLATFQSQHLSSVPALRSLYRQAVARGLIADSEASFFDFLSTAAHCLRVGNRPAALFAYLVREHRLDSAACEDEDAALALLRRASLEERDRRPLLRLKEPVTQS